MKKAIAILLVLLVAGTAFAAEDNIGDVLAASTGVTAPSNAEMYLQANAPGKFVHGFASTSVTSFGQIINFDWDASPYKTVDLTSTAVQDIGYYLIATNAKDDFTVTLSAGQLKSEEFIVDGTGSEDYYYVDYNLILNGATASPIVVDGVTDTEVLYASLSLSGGVLADSTQLQFQLPATLLEDSELAIPEGNYQATISVAVTGL